MSAADVAKAFANLIESDTQSATGPVTNGVYTTAKMTGSGWTSGAANGATVTFEGAETNATTLAAKFAVTSSVAANAPTTTYTAGTNSVTKPETTNTVTNGAVVIKDADGAASITTISVDGYAGTSSIGEVQASDAGKGANVLTDLSLANGASGASMAVATTQTSLNLTVNNVEADLSFVNADSTAGSPLTSLDVTTATKDSAFKLTADKLVDLTVDGTNLLDISTATATELATLKTVTVKGSAGLKLNKGLDKLSAVDASATSGDVTLTVNNLAGGTTYKGGSGVDTITLAAETATKKTIDLGAGDDTLIVGATLVAADTMAATIKGGDGEDTVSMSIASAEKVSGYSSSTDFASKVTGFERLLINDVANISAADLTVDLEALGLVNYVTTTGTTSTAGHALILDNMADKGTVVLTAAQVGTTAGSTTVNIKDAADSVNNLLNIITEVSTADIDAGTLTVANVENFKITANDTKLDHDADGVNEPVADSTLTLVADKAKSVIVDGNANVNLTITSQTIKTVDATALDSKFTFDASSTTAVTTTILSGAGNDDLTANIGGTVKGGAGNDTITAADSATLYGEAGNDIFEMTATAAYDKAAIIMDIASGDTIKFLANATFNSEKIDLGAGVTGPTALKAYADKAAEGNNTNEVSWFNLDGDTYLVQDVATEATFATGDSIIKIIGIHDLSTASFNDQGLTLELA